MQEVFATAERMAANLESDVLWVTEGGSVGQGQRPPHLCVAPLQVWGPMRDKLLTDKLAVFTSATLRLGGDFTAVASSFGLKPTENVETPQFPEGSVERDDDTLPWRGLDVGSPFDYAQQAILYVARHLPPPGRDGLGAAQLDEIVELVDACEGRALGLFSSRRAAEAAAEVVRERLPHLTTLAQGDAQLPELARQFVDDPHTALFGTLSLWQGLDVPGDTCQLVLIDRIPFPRPDDPLMSARQRAADKAGGNGFMQVAATHAALLLAQGTGRLIRTTTDRGVVAVLDPRLATARYGSFLKASLAADVDHHRPGRGPPGAGPAGGRGPLGRPVVARRPRPDETLAHMRARLGRSGLVALTLVAATACASSDGAAPAGASIASAVTSRASAASAAAHTGSAPAAARGDDRGQDEDLRLQHRRRGVRSLLLLARHPRRQRPGGGAPLHRDLQLGRRR